MTLPLTYLLHVDCGPQFRSVIMEAYPDALTLSNIVEDICDGTLEPTAILGVYEAQENSLTNVTQEVCDGVIEEIRRGRMVAPFARKFAGAELEDEA